MTNKRVLDKLIILVVLFLIGSGFKISDGSGRIEFSDGDTLTFIHLTDPHVCNLTGYHQFFVEKRQHFGNNSEPLTNFFKSVPEKYNADFVVITGDNIDYYEAQTTGGKMLDTQIEQFTRLIDNCHVPVYLTLGNHDIASYFVKSDLSYTNNQFNAERARTAWSRNAACFKDGSYYSLVFNINKRSVRLIFLDNAYYSQDKVSDGVMPFIIDQAQLLWLDDQLKISDSDVEIIFMHQPLPYIMSDGKGISAEQISTYSSISNSYNLFNVLEENSSTPLIIAGHKHINSINNYNLNAGKSLTQLMTGAFGYDSGNWRLIKVTNNKILIYSPGSSDIEYSIPVL